MKDIIILGSTGSIGRQTLEVVRRNRDKFRVVGLACGSNYKLLVSQIVEFEPHFVYIADDKLRAMLKQDYDNVIDNIEELAAKKCDYVLTAQVGIAGLLPTIAAIKAGNNIALANKETMVCAGKLINKLAAEHNVKILPVDSEHSAIWQCLSAGKSTEVEKLILTASGGSFRGLKREDLINVTAQDALQHPTWAMGAKITIDSATLMNKGLEVIEAMHLFGLPIDKIDVIMHKQSIIHSMVQYCDGSVIAQMSYPSMELPIQMAIGYPDRIYHPINRLDFSTVASLDFQPIDHDTFGCLDIAIKAASKGGLYPCAMNAANEVLVQAFIDNKITFLDIPYIIDKVLLQFDGSGDEYSISDILAADKVARELVRKFI